MVWNAENLNRGQSLNSMTDAELAALSKEGNLEAFNRLAGRWENPLFLFIRRMLGNDEDARDTCQDAFLKAYQNIGRLRDPAKFKAWLHHIALNLCRDFGRSARIRATQPYEEALPQDERVRPLVGRVEATDRAAERGSLAGLLGNVLGQLPEEQRTAILLREYQGFTAGEIAEITGVPPATVRTRIYYGLRALRRGLAQRGILDAGLLRRQEP